MMSSYSSVIRNVHNDNTNENFHQFLPRHAVAPFRQKKLESICRTLPAVTARYTQLILAVPERARKPIRCPYSKTEKQ